MFKYLLHWVYVGRTCHSQNQVVTFSCGSFFFFFYLAKIVTFFCDLFLPATGATLTPEEKKYISKMSNVLKNFKNNKINHFYIKKIPLVFPCNNYKYFHIKTLLSFGYFFHHVFSFFSESLVVPISIELFDKGRSESCPLK